VPIRRIDPLYRHTVRCVLVISFSVRGPQLDRRHPGGEQDPS